MQYLMIGDGKLAKQLQAYFAMQKISFASWSRSKQSFSELLDLVQSSTHILLLVKDDAIEEVSQQIFASIGQDSKKKWIHCSGALYFDYLIGCHPLQTFAENQVLSLADFQAIPWVIDQKNICFKDLFPQLNNKSYVINPKEKPYYHAMCVMASNLTTLIWHKAQLELNKRVGIDQEDLLPLLKQTISNIQMANKQPVGALARKENKILNLDLQALQGDAYRDLFEAMIAIVQGK